MASDEAAAVWMPIDDLMPWGKNPRVNDRAIPEVMASIRRFGFAAPIVARSNGEIIAGHTRYAAAREMGLDRVPVRVMDLDPADARLLALADNKIGEISDWSEDLGAVLLELEQDGADLEGLGWAEAELSALLAVLETADESDEETSVVVEVTDDIPEDVPAITQPGDVVQLGRHKLTCGDCIEVMRGLPDNSVDAICTDPPYGLGFLNKQWDCAVPGDDFAREALRVLKPGGHLIAFAATRTVHRLAVALENAGMEIRDQISHLQWQGFPKSLDVSKAIDQHHGAERAVVGVRDPNECARSIYSQGAKKMQIDNVPITAPATADAKKWEGWGTALKPSQEPAILARKPLEGTVAENVLKWGVGGLNIDGCRIGYGDPAWPGPGGKDNGTWGAIQGESIGYNGTKPSLYQTVRHSLGRWPANIYYCPKASRSEREAGCDELPGKSGAAAVDRMAGTAGVDNPRAGAGRTAEHVKNHHPTVKPVALMKWLVRLVTPPHGVVLEPFAGSGTTVLAAEVEGVSCLAIEREPHYCDIVRARVGAALNSER
jgi:DNA modification methylase